MIGLETTTDPRVGAVAKLIEQAGGRCGGTTEQCLRTAQSLLAAADAIDPLRQTAATLFDPRKNYGVLPNTTPNLSTSPERINETDETYAGKLQTTPDLLRLDYINSLPQPFMLRQYGDEARWPLEVIDVQTGLLKFVDEQGI